MKLRELLNSTGSDCEISNLQNDSRLVKPGDLFLAYPGAASDGRTFIQSAIATGASAIAYDPKDYELPHLDREIPCIPVPDLAQQLANIAYRFFAPTQETLNITGVTGTNGKTTIAYQLAQAHCLLNQQAAYIGTLGQGNIDALQPLSNTTPDALCIQHLLHNYRNQHYQHVCMEVSSHALTQGRVDHVKFTQAIFTNLSHEHLDYHKTMDAYAAAKARLFTVSSLETMIINHDDHHGGMMGKNTSFAKRLTYGLKPGSDVRAMDCRIDLNGNHFRVDSPWGSHHISLQALGEFNIYNGLAVFTSLLSHGYASTDVVKVMPQLKASPGRMDVVMQEPYVIVDYAHTPDALENVLKTLHPMRDRLNVGKIWVIFGCGGDRDKSKRPLMGKIASQYADHVVITCDNPRTEDPDAIIEDIKQGLLVHSSVISMLDRRQAIQHVLSNANKQDIIVIAGKGHESYQQIGTHRYDFSDQAVVRDYFCGMSVS